ncbi:peptide/nickel transport system permease protein [Methylobacterium pseudosasicola]|uniref:Peptide/nickel transport system permease protein n=2 Tax=Methylobacterium pseudosasicola TaxID=582667 RepID=A0A1I4UM05_9HYPH|nr:peptide/nickel transport system permease protein [Methylobacterium pseudosasicola]
MGLDRPLPMQFWRYLARVLHGDLGTSVGTGQPVLRDVERFFPATVELATVAMAIGIAAVSRRASSRRSASGAPPTSWSGS